MVYLVIQTNRDAYSFYPYARDSSGIDSSIVVIKQGVRKADAGRQVTTMLHTARVLIYRSE